MLPLFYVAELPTKINERIRLVGQVGHHLSRVLRATPGEELLLSDGHGHWSRACVTGVDKTSVDLAVLESGYQPQRDITITVIQAVTKGERTRENLELLVEAGVDRIVPWQAARSIGRLPDGVGKLQAAVIEAGKQSRRYYLPEVADVADTARVLAIIRSADLALVLDAHATEKLTEIVSKVAHIQSVVLVVGPEGGLTDEELLDMSKEGAKLVRLGRPIFRSAHAGIAGVSAVSVALGIW